MVNQAQEGLLSPLVQSMRMRKASKQLQGRLLDFGCGSGRLANFVEQDRYVGFDIDEESIRLAHAEFPRHTFSTYLESVEGVFDTVVALAVIEHIKDRRGFIEFAASKLSDSSKARIVLTTPSPWSDKIHGFAARLGVLSSHAHEEHEDLLGRRDLERLARDAGLQLTYFRRFLWGMNQLAVLERPPRSIAVAGGLTENGIVVGNYFDKYGSKNPLVRRINRGFRQSLESMVHSVGPQSIHEVGCGEGYWVMKWLQSGISSSGSDFSSIVISMAKDNIAAAGGDPKVFSVCSIYDLKVPANHADLVVCCEVLEHVDNPDRALEQICRIAPSHVLLSVPREPLWRLLNVARARYLARLGNTPGHIQHWSKRAFLSFAEEHLDILEVRSPLPWTMVLGRPRRMEP